MIPELLSLPVALDAESLSVHGLGGVLAAGGQLRASVDEVARLAHIF